MASHWRSGIVIRSFAYLHPDPGNGNGLEIQHMALDILWHFAHNGSSETVDRAVRSGLLSGGLLTALPLRLNDESDVGM